jgi:5-methyltetrahydropteroyltriglutamate--homocysteine methyltransferase
VRRQAEAGVDVVSDGEQGKPGFVTYIGERLTGFEQRPAPPRAGPWVASREIADFPEYYKWYERWRGESVVSTSGPFLHRPGDLQGHEAVKRDIENFKAALNGVKSRRGVHAVDIAGNIEAQRKNEYYPNDEAYIDAIADAMREEYKAIVAAGLALAGR